MVGPIPEGCVTYDSGKGETFVTDPCTGTTLIISDENINYSIVLQTPPALNDTNLGTSSTSIQGQTGSLTANATSIQTSFVASSSTSSTTQTQNANPSPQGSQTQNPTSTPPVAQPQIPTISSPDATKSRGNMDQPNLLDVIYDVIAGLIITTVTVAKLTTTTKRRNEKSPT